MSNRASTMRATMIIVLVMLLNLVLVTACATPSPTATASRSPEPLVLPTPTETPAVNILPACVEIYRLPASGGRLSELQAVDASSLPAATKEKLKGITAGMISSGEAFRSRLIEEGIRDEQDLQLRVVVTEDGRVLGYSVEVVVAGDYKSGTMILEADNGKPLFLEPLRDDDQIVPAVMPDGTLTWALKSGDKLLALVDDFNRWTTAGLEENWMAILSRLGITINEEDRSAVTEAVFYALKEYFGRQDMMISSEIKPWQAGAAGEQVLVVAGDGRAFKRSFDPQWGDEYGYVESGGNPVGAWRVGEIAQLPEEVRQTEGRVIEWTDGRWRVVGADGVAYTYDAEQKVWVKEMTVNEQVNALVERWGLTVNSNGEVFHEGQRIGAIASRAGMSIEGLGLDVKKVHVVEVDPNYALRMVKEKALGTVTMTNQNGGRFEVPVSPLPLRIGAENQVGMKFIKSSDEDGVLLNIIIMQDGQTSKGDFALLSPSDNSVGHIKGELIGGGSFVWLDFKGYPSSSSDMRLTTTLAGERDGTTVKYKEEVFPVGEVIFESNSAVVSLLSVVEE